MVRRILILFIVIASTARIAPGQLAQETNDAMAAADDAFVKSDWKTAAAAYEKLAPQFPQRTQFWIRLAMSQLFLEENEKAAATFRRALENKPQQEGFVRYNLACALARLKHNDDAVAELTKSVDLGFARAEAIDVDDDFDTLANDPKFKTLLDKLHNPTRGVTGADALDHWIGEWNVFAGGQLVGRSRITRTLLGYGIEEHWSATGGGKGQSFFVFDTAAGTWKQLWIDDAGWIVEKTGKPIENGIRLEGTSKTKDGKTQKSRETLTKNVDGTVRQFLETYDDEKQEWTTAFDGRYVPASRK